MRRHRLEGGATISRLDTRQGAPPPIAADRLALIALALVAFKFANWTWPSARIPGRGAVIANDALQFFCFLAFVVLIALSCRSTLPERHRRWHLGRALVLAPVLLVVITALVAATIMGSLPTNTRKIEDANAMAVCGAQAMEARQLLGLVLSVVFGVVPWLFRSPDAVSTIWRNLTAATFPLGYGPSLLVLQGLIKAPTPELLLGLSASAMVLILLWGWLRPNWRISAGGRLISWRSRDEYLAQVPLLAVAAIVALLATPDPVVGEPGPAGPESESDDLLPTQRPDLPTSPPPRSARRAARARHDYLIPNRGPQEP